MSVQENHETINIREIKRKSIVGVVALTSRTFILQIIALVSTFILTILLDPAVFGVFFVVTAAVNFLNYFSDIGLAAALIQKKEEPTRDDLVTTFTIQQILVGTAVLIALLLSTVLSNLQKFGPDAIFLFRALAISFFLSSLKTIPSILLERKLEFQKLILPQIVETSAFYIVAITLAFNHYGAASFAWAALFRGILGVVVLYSIAPWRPGIQINVPIIRRLLKFGLPFQANSFLALIKDDLLTVFLGLVLPLTQIGYIGWAKKWAEIALRLIMDNIIRVTFPAYARLQHDSVLLAKAIQKSLLFLALLALPIAVGMMFLVKPFISVVPRYGKWEPALFSFYLFTISSILAALSSPLVNALNALGKVKYTFYLMIMWTTLTWICIPVFVHFYGYNGVSISAVIISFTSFVPVYFLRRSVKFSLVSEIIKPLVATAVMMIGIVIVLIIIPTPLLQLILGVVVGSSVYSAVIYILMGKELLGYFALLRSSKQ